MAKEYIEREAVFDVLFGQYCASCDETEQALNAAIEEIKSIPAADVVPVRHGRWIDKCVRDWRCSVCGGEIDKVRHVDGYCYNNLPRYCPDCGVEMDKDGDGE